MRPSGLPQRLRAVAALLLIAAAPHVLRAQQLPTTEQAKKLLETRPDLVAALQREILSSGLTPDQIRARLVAAGYPENILDGYLVRRSGADSLSLPMPSGGMLDAMSALGMSDPADAADLRRQLRRRFLGPDTGRVRTVDTTMVTDSLSFTDSIPRPVRLRGDSAEFDPLFTRTRLMRIKADSGYTLFGLSVFQESGTLFDANLAGPVDASYRLGPGDRLVLILTGDAERSFNLDVTREGFIVVPGIGEVSVNTLTMGQLEDVLYPRLARVYSGLRRGNDGTTHFSLNLARLHTNQVFVLGDVAQPGSYRVSSAGTALSALYAAGGPTRNGSVRRIEIKRAGHVVDTLDLYDYLLRADALARSATAIGRRGVRAGTRCSRPRIW